MGKFQNFKISKLLFYDKKEHIEQVKNNWTGALAVDATAFFSGNTVFLMTSAVVNFTEIIKITMNLIKTTFKNSMKIKKIINLCIKFVNF